MKTKYIAAIALSLVLFNPLNANAEGKGGIAAVVNGEKITVDEIKNVYTNSPQINSREKWDAFYDKALNVWVSSKLVQQAANGSNVRNSNEYKEQMEALGNDVASKLYLRQELDKRISENDLKNLYNQYKNRFVSEKEMRARHILVDDEATAKDIIIIDGSKQKKTPAKIESKFPNISFLTNFLTITIPKNDWSI